MGKRTLSQLLEIRLSAHDLGHYEGKLRRVLELEEGSHPEGVNFSMKYGIGSFAPAIAGFLTAQYSMDYVFYFFAVISAVAFGVSLMVRDIEK